jgi:hypothetical protein
MRTLTPSAVIVIAALVLTVNTFAADNWIEVKSKNFTAISNAGERSTRTLVWQLEQMRGALTALFSWAKPDLNKPLSVIILKDDNSMRALAPEYWERRGSLHPASLWLTAPDQHYLVMRTDVEVDSRPTENPYISTYFSYVGLMLDQSIDSDVPFWLRRGFTGVLSNTLVHENEILVGPIISWHIANLRERARVPLAKLLTITRQSPEIKQSEFIEMFDAQTWALVHFLMFGENGKRAPQLDAFVRMVSSGKDPAAAFSEALGSIDAIDAGFQLYM